MLTIRGIDIWLINSRDLRWVVQLIITLCSIWNLDFFRSLYPPFCLHPTISALHVLLLDYLVAVYPLILILITYSLVKLHDRYTLVVWFCKPLYICFHKFRKEWDIKTSLVGTFATFYLLSYVKIINVTADILTPTYYYDIEGERSELYFYYNASIPYFGEEHLPYAAFAVIFCFLFNVCPLLLLCLYPCTCFHKCLNKTGCRCHTLHVFMDALLESFSHKPRERRYFGAVYLPLRITHVVLLGLDNIYTYVSGACSVLLGFILLFTLFQPHKKKLHNHINLLLISSVAILYIQFIYKQEVVISDPYRVYNVRRVLNSFFQYTPVPLICVYGLIMVINCILPKKFIKEKLEKAYKRIRCRTNSRNLEDAIPYQLEHDEKDALLQNILK